MEGGSIVADIPTMHKPSLSELLPALSTISTADATRSPAHDSQVSPATWDGASMLSEGPKLGDSAQMDLAKSETQPACSLSALTEPTSATLSETCLPQLPSSLAPIINVVPAMFDASDTSFSSPAAVLAASIVLASGDAARNGPEAISTAQTGDYLLSVAAATESGQTCHVAEASLPSWNEMPGLCPEMQKPLRLDAIANESFPRSPSQPAQIQLQELSAGIEAANTASLVQAGRVRDDVLPSASEKEAATNVPCLRSFQAPSWAGFLTDQAQVSCLLGDAPAAHDSTSGNSAFRGRFGASLPINRSEQPSTLRALPGQAAQDSSLTMQRSAYEAPGGLPCMEGDSHAEETLQLEDFEAPSWSTIFDSMRDNGRNAQHSGDRPELGPCGDRGPQGSSETIAGDDASISPLSRTVPGHCCSEPLLTGMANRGSDSQRAVCGDTTLQHGSAASWIQAIPPCSSAQGRTSPSGTERPHLSGLAAWMESQQAAFSTGRLSTHKPCTHLSAVMAAQDACSPEVYGQPPGSIAARGAGPPDHSAKPANPMAVQVAGRPTIKARHASPEACSGCSWHWLISDLTLTQQALLVRAHLTWHKQCMQGDTPHEHVPHDMPEEAALRVPYPRGRASQVDQVTNVTACCPV